MNLLGNLLRKAVNPYAGVASGIFPGAGGYLDIQRRTPSPGPLELVRENLGTAAACGGINSQAVARTRLRLYVVTRTGQGKSRLSKYGKTKSIQDTSIERLEKSHAERVADAADIEEVRDHPVLTLLKRPNGPMNDGVGMTLFSLLEMTQLFLETVGRSYFLVEREGPGKTPSQIWVLAPQFVTEWPGTGANAPIIAFYEFALGSGKQQYPVDTVVPFRMPDPNTGGYTGGISPLRTCFEAHSLARQVDALTNSRVRNGARPDAVFTPKGDSEGASIGRDEAARLELMLKRRYSMAGAGSMVVMDIPGSITPIAWPINDIIDAARYVLTRSQIAEAYHVPMSKLNRDQSTFAGAKTGEYAHAIDAVLPRLRRFEAALNTFLLPMYGEEAADRLFFAFDDPEGMEDPDMAHKRLELAVKRGAIKNNELRSLVGKKDVPEGEQYLADNTAVPLLPDGKPDPSYIKGAGGGDVGAEAEAKPEQQPAAVPAQNAHAEPKEPKPPKVKKPSAQTKAMLEMAAAVKSLAERLATDKAVKPDSGMVLKTTTSPHKYSCLMAEIPHPHAADVLSFVHNIPEEDLADDGREPQPHVTVKYGLHTNDPAEVKSVLGAEKPIKLSLGKMTVFPANEKRPTSDVVVLDVDSPDLERLNGKINDALDHTDTYRDYTPHLTLAYVKPGAGQKYEGDERFAGRSMEVNRLSFSDKSNKVTLIRLGDAQTKSKAVSDDPVEVVANVVSEVFKKSSDDVTARLKSAGYSDAEIKQKRMEQAKGQEPTEL